MLPAASLARLAAGSSIGQTNTWRCMCSFELLIDDGRKTRLKHLERLTEMTKLWNVASCWLYSANILAMHGPINVKVEQSFGLFEVNSLTVFHAFSRFRYSHSAFSRFCIQHFTNMTECWKVYHDIFFCALLLSPWFSSLRAPRLYRQHLGKFRTFFSYFSLANISKKWR